jgi:tetratricopeptide (TPR) repeat protein
LLSQALVDAVEDELVLPELLEELTRYSLIRIETDARYSIHRIVQEVLRDAFTSEQQQQWVDRVVAALNETFPDPEFENWWRCERLVEQVQAIDLKQAAQTLELGLLPNATGYFLDEQRRYGEAEPLYLQALEIRQVQLGHDHPDTATSLNNLAALYESQGRYGEAEPLYLQAIAILLEKLGEDHPNTQTGLSNFVSLLRQAVEAGRAAELSDHPMTQAVLAQLRNQE